MNLPDTCGQAIIDELNRTGVLSKEFKDQLIIWVLGLTKEAYQRGFKDGKKNK